MLRGQLLVNRLHFVRQVVERIKFFTVRNRHAFPPSLCAPEFFNLAHGAMHRSKLALQLREQIQLEGDESFCFPLDKTPYTSRI
jgi:hypothetical protein